MQTASYSQWLHNQTAFTQINKNDSYITCAWKAPAGRILSASVIAFSALEFILASLATVIASPLYLLDSDRFNTIAADAADSAKTVGRATAQFFGLGENKKVETSQRKTPPKEIPQAPIKPKTGWQKALQFLKNRVSDVTYVTLKNPNTTFVALTIGATFAAAYYFGLFDKAYSLLSKTAPTVVPKTPPPVLKNVCLIKDYNPFAEMSFPADAPAQAAKKVMQQVSHGVCPIPPKMDIDPWKLVQKVRLPFDPTQLVSPPVRAAVDNGTALAAKECLVDHPMSLPTNAPAQAAKKVMQKLSQDVCTVQKGLNEKVAMYVNETLVNPVKSAMSFPADAPAQAAKKVMRNALTIKGALIDHLPMTPWRRPIATIIDNIAPPTSRPSEICEWLPSLVKTPAMPNIDVDMALSIINNSELNGV